MGRRKTRVVLRDSSHSSETRQLENLRKQYTTRYKQFSDTASKLSELGYEDAAMQYASAAANLEHERSQLKAKEITSAKPGSKQYLEDVHAAIEAAKERLKDIPSTKPKELVSRETKANVQFKYADDIFVYAYAEDIWQAGDTNDEKIRKMKEYMVKQDPNTYKDAKSITKADMLDFYENEIRDLLDDPDYSLDLAAVQSDDNMPAIYETLRRSGLV